MHMCTPLPPITFNKDIVRSFQCKNNATGIFYCKCSNLTCARCWVLSCLSVMPPLAGEISLLPMGRGSKANYCHSLRFFLFLTLLFLTLLLSHEKDFIRFYNFITVLLFCYNMITKSVFS